MKFLFKYRSFSIICVYKEIVDMRKKFEKCLEISKTCEFMFDIVQIYFSSNY